MHGYPVNLRKDGKFILVTFPDIPDAITQGDSRAHALAMAKEALELSMEFYFEGPAPGAHAFSTQARAVNRGTRPKHRGKGFAAE